MVVRQGGMSLMAIGDALTSRSCVSVGSPPDEVVGPTPNPNGTTSDTGRIVRPGQAPVDCARHFGATTATTGYSFTRPGVDPGARHEEMRTGVR